MGDQRVDGIVQGGLMEWLGHLIPADPALLPPLDWLMHLLHGGMVLFVLAGWAWRPLLRVHRILLLLIWLSWLGLGLAVGHPGYCILTDYHWRLREAMGFYNLPSSYIEFLLQQIWWRDFPDRLLAVVAGLVFAAITVLSLFRWKGFKIYAHYFRHS